MNYYASSAAASNCAGLSLSPGVATPVGSCYYAVAQTSIKGSPNTQGQTIFINGDATVSAPGIDIFVGDIFKLTRGILGPVDAVYDRAALVALPRPSGSCR